MHNYVRALVAVCAAYCALQIVVFTLHYITLYKKCWYFVRSYRVR